MTFEDQFLRCGRIWHGSGGGGDLKSVLLGGTPRYAPDRTFDSLHIKLDLDVSFRLKTVVGACATTLRAYRDGLRDIEFDAAEMTIEKASFEGKPCRIRHDGKKLTLHLTKPLKAGEEGTAIILYRLKSPRTGLHFIDDSPRNAPQVWSQSQPEDAHTWFPCHDAPQEKASSEMVVSVPEGYMAVSNGTLLDRRRHDGKETFHWKMAQPHSVYLISLAAGRFTEVKDHWENVPVLYYCERGREAEARRGFGKTPQMIDFFSRKIGVRYPYEKYAQVAAAQYPGGMEHTTATTQTDACLLDERAALDTDFDGLVSHELAHQWFGDLVTCKDWSHGWLNEGFATYFEVLFAEHDKGTDEALYELWLYARSYFDEDEKRYRRPIVSERYKYPWVLFDRHLYEKGAAVLHFVRYLLRDKDWWRMVRHYVVKHSNGSVETADLLTAIQEATGRNMKPVFDQWVYGTGYPKFRVQYSWDPAKGEASMWVLQTQPTGGGAPLFTFPVEFYFEGKGWSETFTEKIEKAEHRFVFKLPGEPLQADFDPHRWILKKVEFSKPLKLWERQLTHGSNAVARIEAAYALSNWGGNEAVRALARSFMSEPFWGARARIALALGRIKSESAVRALKGMLATKHSKVRRAVVEALGDSGRSETARWLEPLMRKDPSYHVVAEAARSLGKLREPSWIPALLKTAEKKSWWDVVRAGAATGIACIRDPKAIPLLKRLAAPPNTFFSRAAAIRGLASLHTQDPSVLGSLLAQLDDPDERVKIVAVSSLGDTKDERAVEHLEKIREADPNLRVKMFCDEAISRIRSGVEKEGSPSPESKGSRKPRKSSGRRQ